MVGERAHIKLWLQGHTSGSDANLALRAGPEEQNSWLCPQWHLSKLPGYVFLPPRLTLNPAGVQLACLPQLRAHWDTPQDTAGPE